MVLLLLACASGPAPEPADAPVPDAAAPAVERPAPAAVVDAAGLTAALDGQDENGSCRGGQLRLDGVTVLDARDPAGARLLAERLGSEPLGHAAIAAALLWEARASIPAERAPALAATLSALHRAPALPEYRCRQLKNVRDEGHLWNARGDALALLTLVEDREAARAALATVAAEHALVADPGAAALGDAEAFVRVGHAAFLQLCGEPSLETTWMLRSLDLHKSGGSLEPLARRQARQCPGPDGALQRHGQ